MELFDGSTYRPALDRTRLKSQLERVKALLLDGKWHTLTYLAAKVGGTTAGVSARVRDLRKPKHGGFIIYRRLLDPGVYEYRLVNPPKESEQLKHGQKDSSAPEAEA